MKIISILLLLFSLAQAQNTDTIVSPTTTNQNEHNLTNNYNTNLNIDLTTFISKSKKTWIQTRHKEYRSYKYHSGSKTKPLVVFIMGLGGSIEETSDHNLIIQNYIHHNFNVLILEGSKLGETAIIGLKNEFQPTFNENMDGLEDLYNSFLKLEHPKFSELIILGHSYGAYGASHLASILNQELTVKLIAPGITNFNNRLNSGWLNMYLLSLTEIMDTYVKDLGYKYQVEQVKSALLDAAPDLKKDPLKLNNSAELTVDLGSHHIFDSLRKLHPKSKIQLITGENESFIFPMMHYELYQNLVSASLDVSWIQIDQTDHHIPNHLSQNQADTLVSADLTTNQKNEYFKIDHSNGTIRKEKISDLKIELKTKSYEIWQNFVNQKKSENIYIGLIPGINMDSLYPLSWKP